jgi:PIN domain nuclease of toxin-antitoxin system
MTDEFVVDAHALIWYLVGSPRLGAGARAVMQDPTVVLYLPVIALSEAAWAVEKGRCAIPSVAALLADVDADPRLTLIPLDRTILDLSVTLTGVREMHDRQIVATALHLIASGSAISLLTCDPDIVGSGLVPIVW